MKAFSGSLLLLLLFITTVQCNAATTKSIIENVYIEGEHLIIMEGGKEYVFDDLVLINNTFVTLSVDSNIFFLEYNYTASVVKTRIIVKLLWEEKKIKILKELYLNYHSQKQFDFGWVIFHPAEDYLNLDSLGGIVKYDIRNTSNCHFIIYNSTESSIKDSICDKKENIRLPVFFKEGTFIGFYHVKVSKKLQLFEDIAGDEEFYFISEVEPDHVGKYNDIAYYLEQQSAYMEAVKILNQVIDLRPSRTVAYLNLGDAYFGLLEKNKAKDAYNTYIALMKKNGKDSKIPQRVWDRIK